MSDKDLKIARTDEEESEKKEPENTGFELPPLNAQVRITVEQMVPQPKGGDAKYERTVYDDVTNMVLSMVGMQGGFPAISMHTFGSPIAMGALVAALDHQHQMIMKDNSIQKVVSVQIVNPSGIVTPGGPVPPPPNNRMR